MFARWTDRAKRIMARAEQEAVSLGHDRMGTEHILLAFLNDRTGVGAQVLKRLGVHPLDVWRTLEKLLDLGAIPTPQISRTPGTENVIQFSVEEAKAPKHNYVGSEHLMLGLLREEQGAAAEALRNVGIKLEDAREQLVNLLTRSPRGSSSGFDVAPPPDALRSSEALIHARSSAEVRAARRRDEVVSTAHILLGLISDSECLATKALARLSIDEAKLRDQLTQLLDSDREE